jgi:hypothetical protein
MLVFRLGRAAPVEFVVVQVAPDCRRVGRFRVAGHRGVNRIRFRGRVGGRALRAGTYRIKARTLPRGRAVMDTEFVVVARPDRYVIAYARGADACGRAQDRQSTSSSASALGIPKASAPRVEPENHARPSRTHGLLGAKSAKEAVGAVSEDAVGAFKSIPSLLFVLLGIAIGLLGVAALPSRVAPTRGAAVTLALHRSAVAVAGTALLIAVLVAVTVVYALL